MEINAEGLEELSRGLNQECLETIAYIICSSLAEEDKAYQIEDVLLKYNAIKRS